MYSLELTKPDGRGLTLYARKPIDSDIVAPSPFAEPLNAHPHLRWHPLRGEWVTYAAYRQGRTFLPPPEYNPLGITTDPAHPTEVPAGDWDVAVFGNRFPSLGPIGEPPLLIVPSAPAVGHCEVVVFTKDAKASLGALPLAHIELLMEVWADRTAVMARRGDMAYVLPFENRGAEVGVTLHHPHGQIYAYPVVPPVPSHMQQEAQRYYEAKGKGVLQDLITGEREAGVRMLYEGEHAVAFVPVCARYPYEVWVAPIEPVESFIHLTSEQRADLARALKTVLLKYDSLWQRPFPYLMAWYQAPTDGKTHPESHLHAEFYPPYRTRDRLKYLAGTEIAAGFFAMDALPEEKARELQQVEVTVE
ncbi:UDPglucose--hexose-1-phosphate uridylyltransferase [Nitrosospira multiformis]|uniref:Galactose-1-phosphate uridylyltransferase n=1 Tax=Nitrosospira multiformis TaxID=1231 RepID=A0A1H9YXU2_9PROT|nr:galactose-1-phosphate uridylyltransferase [Nitrosospira multiformis]SES74027.1 UDPglucose--hexose-1-phosphate uridylyltransferase [Nitrosospira multiformis]